METSTGINELSAALAKAQSIIDNPSKDAANPFFKSRYSSLAEVLNVVRPAFSINGLAIMQHPSVEDGKVTVTTLISHSSGQWIKSSITAPAGINIQASGSAITYCRRYALSAIAGVAQEDDDGESAKKADTGVLKKQTTQQKLNLAEYKARFDQFQTVGDANVWKSKFWKEKVEADLSSEDCEAATKYFDNVGHGLSNLEK